MIVRVYVHGTSEDVREACGGYDLDFNQFGHLISNHTYEVSLDIEIDIKNNSSNIVAVNGQKVLNRN